MNSFENGEADDSLAESLGASSSMSTAQFSLCIEGIVRIFDVKDSDADKGARSISKLYLIDRPDDFNFTVGKGLVARIARGERRFREAGLLTEGSDSLILPGRLALDGNESEPIGSESFQLQAIQNPMQWDYNELVNVLFGALKSAIERNEFLLVELAGWDAPTVPYVLFAVIDGKVRIEAKPQPKGSPMWQPHLLPGEPGASVVGSLNENSPRAGALLMAHAVSTWQGVQPWDLTLTYGQYT